jgi:hypothetical protein
MFGVRNENISPVSLKPVRQDAETVPVEHPGLEAVEG